MFYAVCAYLETGEFDEKSFARWMRVVWNIIDDTEISTVSAMITRIRRIKRLTEGNHDIYSLLCDLSQDKQKNAQVKEECMKARAIHDNKLGEDTEQIIKNAKKTSSSQAASVVFTETARMWKTGSLSITNGLLLRPASTPGLKMPH